GVAPSLAPRGAPMATPQLAEQPSNQRSLVRWTLWIAGPLLLALLVLALAGLQAKSAEGPLPCKPSIHHYSNDSVEFAGEVYRNRLDIPWSMVFDEKGLQNTIRLQGEFDWKIAADPGDELLWESKNAGMVLCSASGCLLSGSSRTIVLKHSDG